MPERRSSRSARRRCVCCRTLPPFAVKASRSSTLMLCHLHTAGSESRSAYELQGSPRRLSPEHLRVAPSPSTVTSPETPEGRSHAGGDACPWGDGQLRWRRRELRPSDGGRTPPRLSRELL